MYGLEKNVDGSLKHGCILDEDFPGLTCWYKYGLLHRDEGPAIIDGKIKLWFIQGVQYTKEEFNLYLKKKKLNNTLQSKLKNEQIKPNKSQLKV